MPDHNPRWLKHIIILIFVWMTVNFFPGSYNVDSWYQYFEMEKNKYDDWHSPWFGSLWRVLYLTTDRFFSLYLFQMAWYFVFFYYLLKNVRNKITILIGIASAIFFIFTAQYIMKDTHMALAWGTSGVLLLDAAIHKRKSGRIISFIVITYAAFLRPYSIFAAVPLLYILIEYYSTRTKPLLNKLVMVAVICACISASYFITTYKYLQVTRAYPEYKLRVMDVAGISKLSGHNYMPHCITSYKYYDHSKLLEQYSSATIDHIYWPPGGESILPRPTAEINTCVEQAWKTAIIQNPSLYLKNRFDGFLYYLKIKKRLAPDQYYNVSIYVVRNNYIPIDDHKTPLTLKMLGIWGKFNDLFLFEPWFWLLANILLGIIATRNYIISKNYHYKVIAFVQLSGIIYVLGMFPIFQIDIDFRYTYWSVFAALIGFSGILRNGFRTLHS